MSSIEALSRALSNPAVMPVVAVIFLLPFFAVALILTRRKKAYLAAAHEPFTQLPLRPPGESLRLRLEDLTEQFNDKVLLLGLAGLFAVVLLLVTPGSLRLPLGLGLFVVVALIAFISGRQILALAETMWDYRLGFMGERVVGEELNQLP